MTTIRSKPPASAPASEPATRQRHARVATQQKLDHVLGRAAELIAEKGFEAMSMRDVSAAVGGSLAGLYHYFDSKEELLYYRIFRERFGDFEDLAWMGRTKGSPVA